MALHKKRILAYLFIPIFWLIIDKAHTISRFLMEFGVGLNERGVYNYLRGQSCIILFLIALYLVVTNMEVANKNSADEPPYTLSIFNIILERRTIFMIIEGCIIFIILTKALCPQGVLYQYNLFKETLTKWY